jgi:predicted GIY-YIG superfamily endonuclease
MHIEHLLQRLTVNPTTDPSTVGPISYADSFPYQTCDIQIPHGRTGYVYMLLSIRDTNRTYIGQGTSLSDRLDKHNKGTGATGTAYPRYRPWCLVSYIGGLAHMDRSQREVMERNWKSHITNCISRGDLHLSTHINQGQRLVQEHNENENNPENHIHFFKTIQNKAVRDVETV